MWARVHACVWSIVCMHWTWARVHALNARQQSYNLSHVRAVHRAHAAGRWVRVHAHAHADRIAPGFGVNECGFACLSERFTCGCFSEFRIYLDKPGQLNFGQISVRKSVLVGSPVYPAHLNIYRIWPTADGSPVSILRLCLVLGTSFPRIKCLIPCCLTAGQAV